MPFDPAKLPSRPAASKRPELTREGVMPYLHWIASNHEALGKDALDTHLRVAELAVRVLATEAQGKATQHTLVEDGTIAPPPTAS